MAVVSYLSSATDVRAALAATKEESDASGYRPAASAAKKMPGDKPGEVRIVASLDQMRQWIPGIPTACLEHWSQMSVWCVKMYQDRRRYDERPGLPYKTQVFSESVDIVAAVQWWRLRVGEARKGVAVFEGSFAQEPMSLTEPPKLLADAEQGVVEADPPDRIEAKRLQYLSRERAAQRWESKGMDPALKAKIEAADMKLKAKKEGGEQKYQLGIGWVKPTEFNARRNEIRLRYG